MLEGTPGDADHRQRTLDLSKTIGEQATFYYHYRDGDRRQMGIRLLQQSLPSGEARGYDGKGGSTSIRSSRATRTPDTPTHNRNPDRTIVFFNCDETRDPYDQTPGLNRNGPQRKTKATESHRRWITGGRVQPTRNSPFFPPLCKNKESYPPIRRVKISLMRQKKGLTGSSIATMFKRIIDSIRGPT